MFQLSTKAYGWNSPCPLYVGPDLCVASVTLLQHGGPPPLLDILRQLRHFRLVWEGHTLTFVVYLVFYLLHTHLKNHTWKILMLLSIYLRQELCKQLKAVSWNPKKIPSSRTLMNLAELVQLMLFSDLLSILLLFEPPCCLCCPDLPPPAVIPQRPQGRQYSFSPFSPAFTGKTPDFWLQIPPWVLPPLTAWYPP